MMTTAGGSTALAVFLTISRRRTAFGLAGKAITLAGLAGPANVASILISLLAMCCKISVEKSTAGARDASRLPVRPTP